MKFILLARIFILSTAVSVPAFSQKEDSISINDFSMLVGSWKGTGFGSDVEEVWSKPSAGQMMGMFKMVTKGEIFLTEFMSIQKMENGNFEMLVKHFDPKFEGWEDKDDHISFPLLEFKQDEIVFEGLRIIKKSNNQLRYLLSVKQDDGTTDIVEINYFRQ